MSSVEETSLDFLFFTGLVRRPFPLRRYSPEPGFVPGACVFSPDEVPSWDRGAAVGSSGGEGRSGLSLASVSGSISELCLGLSFSRVQGFRKVKLTMRSSIDMVKASLAWMTPMFHWAWSLRGTEGAVCGASGGNRRVLRQVAKDATRSELPSTASARSAGSPSVAAGPRSARRGAPLLFFGSRLFSGAGVSSSEAAGGPVPLARDGSNGGCLAAWCDGAFGAQPRWRVPLVAGASAPLNAGGSGAQSFGGAPWSPFSTREARSLSLSRPLWPWPAIFCRTPSCSVAAS
ncbi:hypothetical protein EYF80_050675 [Liparis tanakae]|uniref:Uncharacterized protein n=1 Tax=Liparis tanakae TaxID=230148 RepID=A0A4Z2FD26_9TELE|nr:hypothetical protein EYF80_050675 [Liparis tanakae]